MGFLDTLGHAMLDNERLHFAEQPEVLPGEAWLLALGAPLAAFNGSIVNALGDEKDDLERVRSGVQQMWGIEDREGFIATAQWLVDEGQRTKYFAIWIAMQKMDAVRRGANKLLRLLMPAIVEVQAHQRGDAAGLAALTGLERKDVASKLVSSQHWVPDIDKSLRMETAAIRSFVAWDAVRLVNVTRWALQLGWIKREEFASYADGLSGAVREAYANWNEVAATYVLAGLVWNWSEAREEGLIRAYRLLGSDARSPHKLIAFR
jgi:hypothetical protein